jgi:hypothetical protein
MKGKDFGFGAFSPSHGEVYDLPEGSGRSCASGSDDEEAKSRKRPGRRRRPGRTEEREE